MDNTAKQIIHFMDTVEKLCYIKRFTTLKDKCKERDSDHIMKLSFLVMLVSDFLKNNINKTRLFELALVHDLAEADVGDISYMIQYNNSQIIKTKKARELETIQSYQKLLPSMIGNKIADLFSEYEKGETIESKIVQSLDKLEGNLQCCKDVNISTYCHHAAFLSRMAALREHKYGNITREPIINSLEKIILNKSEAIVSSSQCAKKE